MIVISDLLMSLVVQGNSCLFNETRLQEKRDNRQVRRQSPRGNPRPEEERHCRWHEAEAAPRHTEIRQQQHRAD